MCIALVGGMGRLKRRYERRAAECGVDLYHFERVCTGLEKKLNGMDAIVIFTNMVSHNAKKRALTKARSAGIPVVMCHSCGVSSLDRCLKCIKRRN